MDGNSNDLNFQIKLDDDNTDTESKGSRPTDDKFIDFQHQPAVSSNSYAKSSSPNYAGQQSNQIPANVAAAAANPFDFRVAAHPKACFFTFIFKALAIFFYLFLSLIGTKEIIVFIVVLLLSCADFWTVKNITGRFLVGLRWTTSIKEDGQEIWEFESQPIGWEANNIDSSIFWLSQIVAILFFGVLLFANVLTLNIFRSLLNFICVSLYATNFGGFYKCRGCKNLG